MPRVDYSHLTGRARMRVRLLSGCLLRASSRPRRNYMEIIGVIIAGIIIGLLGKFVAPSTRDNIPIWLTILCGIGGVIIGWYIYVLFGGNGSPGIDWTRWLLAIVVAAVLVIAADAIMVRSKSRRTQV